MRLGGAGVNAAELKMPRVRSTRTEGRSVGLLLSPVNTSSCAGSAINTTD
jgi:hypothetical protein